MKWKYIECTEDLPPENEYVLVKFDDHYIGISAFKDGEWEISGKNRRPIYRGKDMCWTSCDPLFWMDLPTLKKVY